MLKNTVRVLVADLKRTVNFFAAKTFLVFWKREIFLSKKKFGGKKVNLAKTIFPLKNHIKKFEIK
jgi:hypothetical protein